ncbi:hypothetical protein BC829DRAFT_1192 [Chytridium lagenaria]|nr:hypothetical protein BC829DRAFT_1192 [Chytridium lagenaria]
MFLRGVLLLVFLLLAPQALGLLVTLRYPSFQQVTVLNRHSYFIPHIGQNSSDHTDRLCVYTFFEDETNPIVVFPASYFFPKTNYTYKTSGQKKVRALASVNNLSSIRTNQSWKDFFKNNAAQILAMTMFPSKFMRVQLALHMISTQTGSQQSMPLCLRPHKCQIMSHLPSP